MVLSDNGKTSRYTYNAAGERIILKSATYWVSWDFACKTTKIHFIVHIP